MLALLGLHTPLDPLHADGYQFWSGIAGELGLLGAFAAWWHHRTCVVRGCWRKGHPDPAHGHPVCRRHSRKTALREHIGC